MTRHRQGWRVLIALSRLAVAGLLITGSPPVIERGRVFAQTDSDGDSTPPPPPTLNSRPLPDPDQTSPVPNDLRAPETAAPANVPVTEPTPAPLTTSVGNGLDVALPTPPSLERLTTQRNSLNQILYRDRRHQVLLTRGEAALSSGEIQTALNNFQALVDAGCDAFFWPDDALAPRGAQSSVHACLHALPRDVREAWERRQGDEARALLHNAIESGSACAVQELFRRYPQTDAGREGFVRELLLAVDTGRAAYAASIAERLAADPYQWEQLSPQMQSLVRRVNESADRSIDFAKPAGSLISPPALRPTWTYSFLDGLQSTTTDDTGAPPADLLASVTEAARVWLDERRDRRFPMATANDAIVAGRLVLVRDYVGVRAINRADGHLLWTFPCQGSLAATATETLQEHVRGGGTPPLNFQLHFAGHGSRGLLTTDGRRVFFIDDSHPAPAPATESSPPTTTNRLVALPLQTAHSAPEAIWVLPQAGAAAEDSLVGHCFLGPPLVVDDRLYAITERDTLLQCVALDASDGDILWRQPIAVAEQPVDWDIARLRIACSPLLAGSIIVCPTEVGVVVGVDALTGSLRWVYDHLDDDQRLTAGRWSTSTQRNYGSTELPSRTLLRAGRLYHLPFRSRFVHCIDATTGSLIWKSERDDGLSLCAATDQVLVLIGPRDVSALSPENGSLLWKAAIPEPAGHGLVAGDRFLLPATDGHCLSIGLSDGNLAGSHFNRLLRELSLPSQLDDATGLHGVQLVSLDEPRPAGSPPDWMSAGGNLVAAGDDIILTTPTSVAVFPQARPLLNHLLQAGSTGALSIEEELEAAMLQLLLGDIVPARESLQQLTASTLPADVRHRATRLLQEVLFAELATASDPRPILDQLAGLQSVDTDRLRLLVSRIDAERRLGDLPRLVEAIDALRNCDGNALIAPNGDAGYTVRALDYAGDQLAEARATASPAMEAQLDRHVAAVVREVALSADIAERERTVTLFDGWAHVAPLRNDVAEACLAAGRLQQAELLLLKNRCSGDPVAAAKAERLLVELYDSQGLDHEAATSLLTLAEQHYDRDVGDGRTGREFVNQFPHDRPAWRIVRRRRAEVLPPYHARITEHRCDESCGSAVECRSSVALEFHDRIRRKFLAGDDPSVTIIDRGIVKADRSQSRLTLLNRETGRLQGEFDVPAAYWQLACGGDGCCGQLLPICGRTAHGLSLLEHRTVWSTHDDESEQTRDKVKIGPIGDDFCVLQTTRQLSVIRPATGELVWSRDDLPPDVGLFSNESTGIIGDRETLTLFDNDQLSYTVYRTRSGRVVRIGRLAISGSDARRHRRAIGAKLVHVVSEETGDRLRIWDAATDRMLLDESLHERLFCPVQNKRAYAYVTSVGQLVIADVETGRPFLDVVLPSGALDEVSDIAVTSDPEQFLVNLVGCPDDRPEDAVAATDEVEVPNIRVQGRLLAISPAGTVLWSQSVSDAVLLTQPDCHLPILTLVSRVRDPNQRQSANLRIDVLDARTGSTLARRDDLLRTRIVQADYRPRPGQLTLIGLDSQIGIDFGPDQQDLLIHAEVDDAVPSLVR